MINQIENILKYIRSSDRVLDVGGGLSPFPRADAVIDILTIEQAQTLLGDRSTHFSKKNWFSGDVCSPEVWSKIRNRAFDFVICSHTLEDVRDPLFVCSQLQRVGKAGYIEFPSRFRECAKTRSSDASAGWDHHRWIISVRDGRVEFKQKSIWISQFDFLGEEHRNEVFDYFRQFTGVLWRGSFDYSEFTQKEHELEVEDLFYFYDQVDFQKANSFDSPPTFYTIERIPFQNKTLHQTDEYLLEIENHYSREEILSKFEQRMSRTD